MGFFDLSAHLQSYAAGGGSGSATFIGDGYSSAFNNPETTFNNSSGNRSGTAIPATLPLEQLLIITYTDASTAASVTVGGTAFTEISGGQSLGSSNRVSAWYGTPGGSGNNIVVNYGGASNRDAVSVYNINGLSVIGDANDQNGSLDDVDISLNTNAGDIVILAAMATDSATFTASAGTENVDGEISATGHTYMSALVSSASGGTPETFTIDADGATTADVVGLSVNLR